MPVATNCNKQPLSRCSLIKRTSFTIVISPFNDPFLISKSELLPPIGRTQKSVEGTQKLDLEERIEISH